jgi:hypothetical protein
MKREDSDRNMLLCTKENPDEKTARRQPSVKARKGP